jgi:hypothetical protein
MKFSKDSEQMMSIMMDDFEKFIKKKSSSQQRTFDRIMKNFYSEVKSADKFTDKLWKDGKVKVNIREIHDFRSIRHTSLLSSTYTPVNIKKYIKSNIKGVINYNFSAGGRSITVNFYLMHNSEFNQLIKFDKLVYKMIMWLKMVSSYTRSRCSRTLKVNCYMTPLKKILPNSPFTVLSSNHANTAVTTSCTADGEICLYRKEEISSYNLYEGYTEFWATIMNCVFTAYYMSKDSRDPNEFYLYAEYCIAFEQFFSLFQCVKVLDFMGLSYHNLHGKDNLSERARKYLYKEETNIFAYYVIKCILLYNFIPFINWCKSNNDNILSFYRSKDNLMRFYRFIMLHYRSKQFNAELDRVQKVLKLHKSNVADNDNKIIAKTMRMTIIELL